MNEPIRLTLPWEHLCPDNARTGVFKGRILLSSRYRASKKALAYLALAEMRKARKTAFSPECALSMHVVLYPPDARRRDATNVAKGLHDSLEGVCYSDDTQLKDVRYTMREADRAKPRAEVTLTTLTQTEK